MIAAHRIVVLGPEDFIDEDMYPEKANIFTCKTYTVEAIKWAWTILYMDGEIVKIIKHRGPHTRVENMYMLQVDGPLFPRTGPSPTLTTSHVR